jgi:hypothetical protein
MGLVCALDAESCVPVGAPSDGRNVYPGFGRRCEGMAVGDVGEREFGEVGVDMEPAFLELAEALKWPHFGHTYSNGKGKRSVRMTEIRSINQQMPRNE